MAGFSTKVTIVVLVLAAMASASPSIRPKVCKNVACPTSYMPGNYLTANPSDPCSFCQCVWGSPVLQKCARGLGWNEMYSQCVPNPFC